MTDFSTEFIYKTSRSGGAGGQHVNKVETAVSIFWNVTDSAYFSHQQKQRILIQLKNRINADGYLQISCHTERSQLQNKRIAKNRLFSLVEKALILPKKRIKTKPSRSQKEKRRQHKKHLSEKKQNRRFRY